MSQRGHARRRRDHGIRRALLPVSIIMLAALAVGVGWHTFQQRGSVSSSPTADPAPTRTSSAPATTGPARTTSPTTSPTSSPTAPSASATTADRTTPVAVLNASGTAGAAARMAGKARSAGWNVTDVGNWTSAPPSTTVYYPAGQKAAAQLLADDLGIGRIRATYAALPSGTLVVVIA